MTRKLCPDGFGSCLSPQSANMPLSAGRFHLDHDLTSTSHDIVSSSHLLRVSPPRKHAAEEARPHRRRQPLVLLAACRCSRAQAHAAWRRTAPPLGSRASTSLARRKAHPTDFTPSPAQTVLASQTVLAFTYVVLPMATHSRVSLSAYGGGPGRVDTQSKEHLLLSV